MAVRPRRAIEKPPSLAQLFEAPEGYRGRFGWVCGYSADTAFLNDAAERFTQQTRAQRAHTGRVALALMLDPSRPQISSVDVPGVVHIPMLKPAERPFRLMHAKVALLEFRDMGDPGAALLRLIVSTGNWTQATLQESLDLAWYIDLLTEDLKASDAHIRQVRSDISAAWELMRWLRVFFDTRVLTSVPADRTSTETNDAYEAFEELAGHVRPSRGVTARFFDSRKAPLLRQLPKLITRGAAQVARNYLAMGSGFYEAPKDAGQIPAVLESVVTTLQENGLVTRWPDTNVFVNPAGCQAVARALPALEERGWHVRSAHKPDYFGAGVVRSLHAKFLFSANQRGNSNTCNSAWVYLGSGNLTGPGFTHRMSRNGGNLEAGVVFAPEALYWTEAKGVSAEQVVMNVLPIHWSDDDDSQMELMPGAAFELPETEFTAPPVSLLVWVVVGGELGRLEVLDGDNSGFEVMSSAGAPCERFGDMQFVWQGDVPRQVKIQWVAEHGAEMTAWVAVMDSYGRLAATPMLDIGLEEAWWQLDNFPMPPEDEDLQADGAVAAAGAGFTLPEPSRVTTANYPIRKMMQLVENIASRQTAVTLVDWNMWCDRIEQVLTQAARCGTPAVFVRLGINPLSPLRSPPFRPTFAETDQTPQGQRYERALDRIERAWHVADLVPLGAD